MCAKISENYSKFVKFFCIFRKEFAKTLENLQKNPRELAKNTQRIRKYPREFAKTLENLQKKPYRISKDPREFAHISWFRTFPFIKIHENRRGIRHGDE